MTDEQAYVRLGDVRAMGFSRVDAERLIRRAARKHGAYKTGRYLYVTREAIDDAINESRVAAT